MTTASNACAACSIPSDAAPPLRKTKSAPGSAADCSAHPPGRQVEDHPPVVDLWLLPFARLSARPSELPPAGEFAFHPSTRRRLPSPSCVGEILVATDTGEPAPCGCRRALIPANRHPGVHPSPGEPALGSGATSSKLAATPADPPANRRTCSARKRPRPESRRCSPRAAQALPGVETPRRTSRTTQAPHVRNPRTPSGVVVVGWVAPPADSNRRIVLCTDSAVRPNRCDANFGGSIAAGQGVFSKSQGYPRTFVVHPQARPRRPPFMHRLRTPRGHRVDVMNA
jgi:hypothetical protein